MTFPKAVCWVLRLASWACVLLVIGRIVFQPRRAALEARAFQMHVRLEAERAADGLFREIGLARHFDPTVFYLVSTHSPGELPPMWLGLDQRARKGTLSWASGIWLESNGEYLLPPLDNSPRAAGNSVYGLEHFLLSTRDGKSLHAAWAMQSVAATGGCEDAVWVHRGDRWVNVLYLRSRVPGELSPTPSPDRARALELGHPVVASFVWDPDSERFQIPQHLDSRVQVLDALPDQVWAP